MTEMQMVIRHCEPRMIFEAWQSIGVRRGDAAWIASLIQRRSQ